jgi:hypothetical protein
MDVMVEFVNVIVTDTTRIRLAADSDQASRSGYNERLLLHASADGPSPPVFKQIQSLDMLKPRWASGARAAN